jgi:hypothetical protein
LYIVFLMYLLIILMPTIPIFAFETSSLFNSYYHKEWPVYEFMEARTAHRYIERGICRDFQFFKHILRV